MIVNSHASCKAVWKTHCGSLSPVSILGSVLEKCTLDSGQTCIAQGSLNRISYAGLRLEKFLLPRFIKESIVFNQNRR